MSRRVPRAVRPRGGPRAPALRPRDAVPALALLCAGFAATLWLQPWSYTDARYIGDLYIYAREAAPLLDGGLPYRDVFFEYPPLAAPVVALPGLAGTDPDSYWLAFAALTLLLATAVVLLVGVLARRTGGEPRRAMLATALLPLLLGALVRTRMDLAPVALLLAALVLLCARRPTAGMAVLALGVMMKGFPIAAAPACLAWVWAREGRAVALRAAGALALVTAALAVAAVAVSSSGARAAVSFQLDRPVQIESLPATIAYGLEAAGASDATPVHSFRSDGIEHPAADALVAVCAAAFVGVLALLALGVARCARGGGANAATRPQRAPPERALLLGALASVAAFAALGKVLSPQYLIWIVPLGALALAWRMHALAALVGVAALLTLAEFPDLYERLIAQEPAVVALVAARNVLLLGVIALALGELRPRAAPAAARPPRRQARLGRRWPAPTR